MADIRINDPLTAEQLRAILDYNPDTGIFTWRHRADYSVQWNGKWAGKQAGGLSLGYMIIRLQRRTYRCSRLAWLFVHGEWPEDFVDHVNGDKSDDRIINLRSATKSQNAANMGVPVHNTSGLKGVFWNAPRKKWTAQINWRGAHYFLGNFETAEEAHDAYRKAAVRMQGEFAKFG